MAIAVIGHSYVFNDEYVSSRVLWRLQKSGIRALTSDTFSDSQVYSVLHKHKQKTHWNLGDRVLGSAMLYSARKDVDGIIYMTPFSCSSDSLVAEYMQEHIGNKPFMTLTVDEHTGDAGLVTRLEAFVDLIVRKGRKAGT
jgi:predicted nucleotide-binding protein (sugar kinase/HSP70/actin superfamily)